MESNLLQQFLENCKQSKTTLAQLKNLAVKVQDYEFAANVRELETTLFPQTLVDEAERKKASDIAKIFGMFNLQVKPREAWLVNTILEKYRLNGTVTSDDVFDIRTECDNLFVD